MCVACVCLCAMLAIPSTQQPYGKLRVFSSFQEQEGDWSELLLWQGGHNTALNF